MKTQTLSSDFSNCFLSKFVSGRPLGKFYFNFESSGISFIFTNDLNTRFSSSSEIVLFFLEEESGRKNDNPEDMQIAFRFWNTEVVMYSVFSDEDNTLFTEDCLSTVLSIDIMTEKLEEWSELNDFPIKDLRKSFSKFESISFEDAMKTLFVEKTQNERIETVSEHLGE